MQTCDLVLVSAGEAAYRLGCSDATIRRLEKKGVILSVRVGGMRRIRIFRRRDVEALAMKRAREIEPAV
jgi:excisionase family DNA binding protein